MNRLPLIQYELGRRRDLDHLDVVVSGLLFVEERSDLRRLDSTWQEDPRKENRDHESGIDTPPRPKCNRGNADEREPKRLDGWARAERRDEPEHRQEGAQDAAHRGQRVYATRGVTAGGHVFEKEPDRERAHAAEQ